MIYLNFILDYFISIISPFKTYFVIYDIDKNSIIDILIIGLFSDFIVHKLFFNTIILLVLYILFKKARIKNKWLKNILLFIIYFHYCFFMFGFDITKYFVYFFIGGISYLLYILFRFFVF